MPRFGLGSPRAARGDPGEKSYLPSLETDMSVIFSRPVPFVAGSRSPGPATDAGVIFQDMAGPGITAPTRRAETDAAVTFQNIAGPA